MKGEWLINSNSLTTVIFVHGFLSDSNSCWKHKNGTFWPELLNNDYTNNEINIYVFSYQTSLFSGSYTVSDVVDTMSETLILDNVLSKNTIFVCHSMGGIIARKYIVDKSAVIIEKQIKIGLFLVASPSIGSYYAKWFKSLIKLFNQKQGLILEFSDNNLWLNDLDKSFINLKESRRIPIKGKELIEDKFVYLRFLIQKQVVSAFSAAKYFENSIKIPESNHSTISKPENSNSFQHKLLKQFIDDFYEKDYVEKINKKKDNTLGENASVFYLHFDEQLNLVSGIDSIIEIVSYWYASQNSSTVLVVIDELDKLQLQINKINIKDIVSDEENEIKFNLEMIIQKQYSFTIETTYDIILTEIINTILNKVGIGNFYMIETQFDIAQIIYYSILGLLKKNVLDESIDLELQIQDYENSIDHVKFIFDKIRTNYISNVKECKSISLIRSEGFVIIKELPKKIILEIILPSIIINYINRKYYRNAIDSSELNIDGYENLTLYVI